MATRSREYTLPGEWWSVPLALDAEARSAAIQSFVRTHYGKRDDLAQLRAEHRSRLIQAIDAAIAGGATQYFISLANDAGVTLASTLSEYLPESAFGFSVAPAVVAEHLVRALYSSENANDDHWAAFEAHEGAIFAQEGSLVVRSVTRRDTDSDSGSASLTVNYWTTIPETSRVVLTSFSTSLHSLEPLMLELFDRIIAASVWQTSSEPSTSRTLREELRAGYSDHAASDDPGPSRS